MNNNNNNNNNNNKKNLTPWVTVGARKTRSVQAGGGRPVQSGGGGGGPSAQVKGGKSAVTAKELRDSLFETQTGPQISKEFLQKSAPRGVFTKELPELVVDTTTQYTTYWLVIPRANSTGWIPQFNTLRSNHSEVTTAINAAQQKKVRITLRGDMIGVSNTNPNFSITRDKAFSFLSNILWMIFKHVDWWSFKKPIVHSASQKAEAATTAATAAATAAAAASSAMEAVDAAENAVDEAEAEAEVEAEERAEAKAKAEMEASAKAVVSITSAEFTKRLGLLNKCRKALEEKSLPVEQQEAILVAIGEKEKELQKLYVS